MKLLEIEISNFMVFGEGQKLSLQDLGLTLIKGINEDADSFESNGSGKSTLISAIIYALFGKTPDGSGGDSVINNKVGKNTEVILKFEQGTHEYTVKRYRKHSKLKNKVLLFRYDEEITESSTKLTDEKIRGIIGIDLNTYLHSIVFGLGNVANFSEATDKEKKAILEDIANIAIYKNAQEIAKEELKNSTHAVELKQKDYDSLKQQFNEACSILELTEDDYIKERDKHNKDIADAKQQLGKADDYTKQLDQERALNAQLLDQLNQVNQTPVTQRATQELSVVGAEYKASQRAVKQLAAKLDDTKSKFVQLKESDAPVCLYCGNPLDAEHRKKELERLLNEYNTIKEQGIELHTTQVGLIQKGKQLRDAADKEKDASQAKANQVSEITQQIQASNQRVHELTGKQSYYQSLKEIVTRGAVELKGIEEKYPKRIKQYDEKQADLSKQLVAVSQANDELEKQTEKLKEVVQVYSDQGVKSHVLDLVMPFINQRANYYLGELSDNTITLNISTQTTSKQGNTSDKLDVQVNNLNGGQEYGLNSKGERRRIDLAISLALQDYVMAKTNTKTNFIAYDEVFDGLDGVGIQRVMNILKERVKEVPTILVVSHNAELKELFESTITVKKEKGLSVIVED